MTSDTSFRRPHLSQYSSTGPDHTLRITLASQQLAKVKLDSRKIQTVQRYKVSCLFENNGPDAGVLYNSNPLLLSASGFTAGGVWLRAFVVIFRRQQL